MKQLWMRPQLVSLGQVANSAGGALKYLNESGHVTTTFTDGGPCTTYMVSDCIGGGAFGPAS